MLTADSTSAPTEIRLFKMGLNETHNGPRIFDAGSAKSVTENYERYGLVRLPIDFDHKSVFGDGPADAGKAAGSFVPEVRDDGLWATDIQWTDEARAAIEAKHWMYHSPAFEAVDAADGAQQVVSILNFALTNYPATYGLNTLVNRIDPFLPQGDPPMNAEQFAALAEALGLGGDATFEDVFGALSAVVQKVKDAANGTTPAPAAEEPSDDPGLMAAAPPEAVAMTARILTLSGKPGATEALAEVEVWRSSHIELASEKAKIAREREALESGERRTLVATLVKLGCETPATAWADPIGTVPCKRLTSEPLADLRVRVATLHAARVGRNVVDGPKPPASGAPALSARELAMCTAKKIEPAKYAAQKAAIAARSGRSPAQES